MGINFRGTGSIRENREHFYTLEIYPLYGIMHNIGTAMLTAHAQFMTFNQDRAAGGTSGAAQLAS